MVDASGKGVPGLRITFRGLYSDTPLGLNYGKAEQWWQETVITQPNGDFDLEGVLGQSVGVAPNGLSVGLEAIGLPKSADPLYGVRMNDRSSRLKLPDTPRKRITYRIIPKQ